MGEGGIQAGWVKKVLFWKDKESTSGGFDHEFHYHHALYVGYNVTNTLYATIKAVKGVWGLPPENVLEMHFLQRCKCPFASLGWKVTFN